MTAGALFFFFGYVNDFLSSFNIWIYRFASGFLSGMGFYFRLLFIL